MLKKIILSLLGAGSLAYGATQIQTGNIADLAVTAAKIANLTVTGAKIANTTVDLTTKVTGTLPAANGGTGQTSVASSFVSFYESVATTLGDVLFGGASGTPTRLAGNTTSTKKFLTQTGNGSISAAPAWNVLVGSDLPNPSSSTLGGIQSYAAVTNQWINTISTSGVPSSAQPAFTNISGSVAASQIPNPSSSTLGGVQSIAVVSNNFLTGISTSGVPSQAQPAFTNLSGTATVAQTTIANQALTTCSTARTVDWSTGNNFTLTLTNGSTCALTWSNAASGQSICIDLYQPGTTGSAAISFATTTLKTATYTMSTGASATDTICVKYNGTDYRMVPQQVFL